MASSKISDLAEATSLADTDLFVIAQEDAANKKVTLPTLRAAVAVDPIEELYGAPDTAFEFNTTSLTGLTAMGSATDESADSSVPGHYYVRVGANASFADVGRYAATPSNGSSPFTAITLLQGAYPRADFNAVGMFLGAATPGALVCINVNRVARRVDVDRHSSPSAYGSNVVADILSYSDGPLYMAIRVNSTTSVDYLLSHTGWHWHPIAVANNPSLTIGSVGMFVKSENSTFGMSGVWDYLRIWNSALTFPGVA